MDLPTHHPHLKSIPPPQLLLNAQCIFNSTIYIVTEIMGKKQTMPV